MKELRVLKASLGVNRKDLRSFKNQTRQVDADLEISSIIDSLSTISEDINGE